MRHARMIWDLNTDITGNDTGKNRRETNIRIRQVLTMKRIKSGNRTAGKGIPLLLTVIMLLTVMLQTAYAGNWPVDVGKTGSISVNMKAGGNLVLYKVADVIVDEGYRYKLTSTFSGVTGAASVAEKINDQAQIGNAALASTLASYASANGVSTVGTRSASSNGTLKFENLPVGLYLVTQTTAAKGYQKMAPFLVSLPGENGTYDVNATPKMELKKKTKPPKDKTPPPSKLPQTGQLWWPVFVLAAAGMLLMFAGLLLKRHDSRRVGRAHA